MNHKVRLLGEQARELSPDDRIALVEDVLDTLDRVDPRADRQWAKEAEERLAAYRRGEIAAKELSVIVAKYRS